MPATALRPQRLARLGAAVVRHRVLIVCAWLLLFVVGIVLGGTVFSHLRDGQGNSSTESVRGAELLNRHSTAGGALVAVVEGPAVDDAAVRTAVLAAATRVGSVPSVTSVETAYDSDDPLLRGRGGRSSLMFIATSRTSDSASAELVNAVRAAVTGSVPGATVTVGGHRAVMQDLARSAESDLLRGEAIALPLLLLALLLVFRGVRAALIPVLGALATVAGGLLLLRGATEFMDVAGYAVDVVALFGLALAVDYSLLLVNRFREERGLGYDLRSSVIRAMSTAGRTITFSGLIIIASLAGLLAFEDPTFTSLALGGIATTLIALLAGLTLVPALLAVWGARISARPVADSTDGVFARLALRVQRRPLLFAAGAVAALLAAGVPFLSVNVGQDDPRVLPLSFDSRVVADALLADFPGSQAEPIKVVARRSAEDPEVRRYAQTIRQMRGVLSVHVHPVTDSISVTAVVADGAPQSPAASRLVADLRASRPSHPTYVTGNAAFLADFKHSIATRLPWALLLMAGTTFALLFLMTGSLLVPIKALVMNTLSLGATFGALVWVFQDGHLSGLLGFESFGAIEIWVPVVVFVFSFGLSMDYEVFLLSRIKEAYDEHGDSDRAVVAGLQRSGRIITSAAGLVMIVFLGFAAGQNLGIKQMGLALAIAVLVDATIVRCILVPATMTLLGRANWWAPAPLRRLHDRFGLSEQAPSSLPTTTVPSALTR